MVLSFSVRRYPPRRSPLHRRAFADTVRSNPDPVLQDGYKVCAALGHGISMEEVTNAFQRNISRDTKGAVYITPEQAQQYVSAAKNHLCP
ncbi:DUF732 domain-containing protein [Nocardia sp. SYP-A9097]|uniref:DUF732 domain-containing protein n=1 Tax=Nocardia sp. SYP-A9097 TaxID=2663237 RepID=UPI001890F07F|nr:DUF732 domain-containing protein [Nocardia sp. SYP-A9097]